MLKLSLNLISVIFFPPLLVFQGKKKQKKVFFHFLSYIWCCLPNSGPNQSNLSGIQSMGHTNVDLRD